MFCQTKKFSVTSLGKSTSKSRELSPCRGHDPGGSHSKMRNGGDRISAISGRLYSIRGRLHGTAGTIKLLVDSGASINLIKENLIDQIHEKIPLIKEFSMGNNKHRTSEVTKLKFQGKEHLFVIVPENFPIPENGIIVIPFLHSYWFNLSNKYLQLDDKRYSLESDGYVIPKNTIKVITIETTKQQGDIIIEDHVNIPDSIYRIRDSKVQIPISNNSETDLKLRDEQINYKFINVIPEREERISYITQKELNVRLKLLNENLRLKHIENVFKPEVEKIVTSYHDVFTLPGDPLPSTGLTSHKIILKDEGIINVRQP